MKFEEYRNSCAFRALSERGPTSDTCGKRCGVPPDICSVYICGDYRRMTESENKQDQVIGKTIQSTEYISDTMIRVAFTDDTWMYFAVIEGSLEMLKSLDDSPVGRIV